VSAAQSEVRVDDRVLELLRSIAPAKADEPLARHTTFGIGGTADAFVTVRSAGELAAAVRATRELALPCFVLGAGSNILVGDAGIRGVVIDNHARGVFGPRELAGEYILRAESGLPFATLARNLARQGFAGVEWACGIPGTLGGAVVSNAGAHDHSLSDVLRSVTVLDEAGDEREIPAASLGFAYRESAFTRGELAACVVLAIEITVAPGDRSALTRKIALYDQHRTDAQPRGRNSGSMFKNPPGHAAWQLIDAVGLRGERRGDVQVSEKHCNFFLNFGNARAADVCRLMEEAKRRVRERFGIELENEIELVGEGFA
jgi:UDP-N-acetylmuramate dehydrogenase